MSGGLTDAEIVRIVNRYIGVSGGYLGLPDRFTYRTHADFYAEYCDLSPCDNCEDGETEFCFLRCDYNKQWEEKRPCENNCEYEECGCECPYYEKLQIIKEQQNANARQG